MQREVLKLGVTAGDPAGIGPEVALKSINALDDHSIIPILIGRATALEKNYPGLFSGYEIISRQDEKPVPGKKYLLDVPLDLPVPKPGGGTIDTGREALACIDAAIELWRSGAIDAVVTAPVSKGLIEKTGVHFTGHTEYMAEKIGEADRPLMMMFSEKYRVLLASTHVPVSGVTGSLGLDRILAVIRAGYASIRSIDGGAVRLAITGLDPHCGDDGAIGTFDREVTSRAVAIAREEKIPVEGPFAADTLFIPSVWERYSLVIAQYHDQGLIPFKMLAFDEGVNVTLGLSMVRTSVDHGTAFDIAGNNMARWSSMTEAIMLARRLASVRGGQATSRRGCHTAP
ncbi:MAG TPA: 4-hydroxythreonine-4-phosphate dehydrogenase PdxA [Spirochaetota bacterium]|nr:4-hydroxythreonine-4-phosphate dehydrogenase PdxA [Spirochaetota bacterium]HPC40556.1 4-hydroxythreonine-4-phosphate dehydrogenase PdxA [Spirochaetota bacterium]HRS76543.1 4-hydroxythreonine-4-phosphate dehydrogenase PdxA [Spirochaetota bacterium]HRT74973.1 4-hydroxythreonine-4-phosphate dehydrogenase PdxA [Spirochaetota bacterium]